MDAEELRRQGSGEHVTELSFEFGSDYRDVTIFGVSTLSSAKTQDPLK
jgi:hypothetical protein